MACRSVSAHSSPRNVAETPRRSEHRFDGVFDPLASVADRGSRLLLAGAPRTGTTWLGRVLAHAPSVRYIYEPLIYGALGEKCRPIRYRYLGAGDEDPETESAWSYVLSMRVRLRHRWLLGHSRRFLQMVPFWPARLMVKEVRCVLALDWIAKNLGMRIGVTIRHPCGYVASGIRLQERGHNVIPVSMLVNQPRLRERLPMIDFDRLAALTDPIAQMAAGYGVAYSLIADQLREHPDWALIRHEAMLEDPEAAISGLCTKVDLPFTDRMRSYLDETDVSTTGGDNLYSGKRRRQDEREKWKRELSPRRIDTIQEVVASFHLPFYPEFA